MKHLNIIVLLLLVGCAPQVKEAPETTLKIQQQSAVIANIVNYLGQLVEKGELPKPEVEKPK